jgi:hypothetical protein
VIRGIDWHHEGDSCLLLYSYGIVALKDIKDSLAASHIKARSATSVQSLAYLQMKKVGTGKSLHINLWMAEPI